MARRSEILRRLVQALFGGVALTAACAALEALWARGASGAAPPPFLDVMMTCFAILAPLGIATALAIGAAFVMISPSEPPSPSGWIARLRRWGAGRQADVAAFTPLAVLGAFLWMTSCAHLARAVLGLAIEPRLAGLAAMAGALALGVLFAVVTLACVPPLRRGLAMLADSRPASLDPALTGGTALLLVLALFLLGMSTGTVSGEGGFFGIYGIFKRPELDLRVPCELLAISLGALFAPSFSRPPRSPTWLTLLLLGAVSLAPAALLPHASKQMTDSVELSLGVERGAPLTRLLLPRLRAARDADGDGFSAAFGGGDCDDRAEAIHPGADEIVDNGVDEDCSGADLTRRIVDSLTPAPEAVKVDERLVPKDLNVVLVTIDTLRYDLGFMGYERPISPNIDALAARSTVFERAYALASYTGKSIGPMLIGKYGEETNRNWGHFNKFTEADTFLAERLQRAGVRTLAVHGHRYFDEFGGLDRGFDKLDFSAAPPKDAPWDVDTKATSAQITDAAIALLQDPDNTKGRFFMWVHYLDPHADYLRHEGIDFGRGARDLYDGEVAFTDKHVGRLLAAIDEAPWGKRTAVVLTSDHGEAFGEHGMYRHGFEVWEPLVRVPLVVHVPGQKPKRVKARRSLVDLAPTILELMQVEGPPSPPSPDAPTDFLSGHSLLVDVFLPDGKDPAARDVLVDMPAGPYNDARRALIHGDLKLVVMGEARFSLYDIGKDPLEENDLAERDKDALRRMKERYAAFKARLREVKVTGKRK